MSTQIQQSVPDGYKLTEVGVIPEGWEVCNIGQFSPYVTSGSRGWAVFYSVQGDLFVRITNMKRDSVRLNLQSNRYVSLPELSSEGKRTSLENGDLLISITADIGIISYVDEYLPKPAYINQHIALVRFQSESINAEFVSYYLASENVQRLFRGNTDQGAKAGINLGAIRDIKFALPGIGEQNAVACAFSDVDSLIISLEELIVKKRSMKTAAMQQLLTGKKRLPPFDERNTGYKQTELGVIPEDWEVVELGSIGQTIIGLTYSPNDVVTGGGGTLVLRSSNIQQNKLAFENNVFVNMNLPDRVLVREGDILVCVRNGSKRLIGKCALIDKNTEGVAFGAFMSIYRTEFNPFIFFQFQSNIIQRQIDEIMGATINQITNKDMAAFKVLLPNDKGEQKVISDVLLGMDLEIDSLEQRLNKIIKLKQGMMQELLTGKTRLLAGSSSYE